MGLAAKEKLQSINTDISIVPYAEAQLELINKKMCLTRKYICKIAFLEHFI
jgi:hypothetical protein